MENELLPPIELFRIEGLYDSITVEIPFDNAPNIFIGENGTGKTTILNALYYTLSGQLFKLSNFDFESIYLKFRSGKEVQMYKKDLAFFQKSDRKIFGYLKEFLGPEEMEELFLLSRNRENLMRSKLYSKIRHKIPVPFSAILRELDEMSGIMNESIFSSDETIKNEIKEELMYFPTYRRIEEDLKNLGYKDIEIDKNDSKLIQFGMSDVSERFETITEAIKTSAIAGLSEVTGEMLSQLVDGIIVTKEMLESIKDPEALKIVLDRVGDNIPRYRKTTIQHLINSAEITAETKNNPLVYFLSKLIKIYDKEKEKENNIKRFVDVCNGYLINTKIIYNESEVKIKIIRTSNEAPIPLSKLSSGEKQIVSLFAKLYLGSQNNFILIFDEPELSLSIEWQKKLLPDILSTGKCVLMLAATHSPYIFDNHLDQYAVSLQKYYKIGKHI